MENIRKRFGAGVLALTLVCAMVFSMLPVMNAKAADEKKEYTLYASNVCYVNVPIGQNVVGYPGGNGYIEVVSGSSFNPSTKITITYKDDGADKENSTSNIVKAEIKKDNNDSNKQKYFIELTAKALGHTVVKLQDGGKEIKSFDVYVRNTIPYGVFFIPTKPASASEKGKITILNPNGYTFEYAPYSALSAPNWSQAPEVTTLVSETMHVIDGLNPGTYSIRVKGDSAYSEPENIRIPTYNEAGICTDFDIDVKTQIAHKFVEKDGAYVPYSIPVGIKNVKFVNNTSPSTATVNGFKSSILWIASPETYGNMPLFAEKPTLTVSTYGTYNITAMATDGSGLVKSINVAVSADGKEVPDNSANPLNPSNTTNTTPASIPITVKDGTATVGDISNLTLYQTTAAAGGTPSKFTLDLSTQKDPVVKAALTKSTIKNADSNSVANKGLLSDFEIKFPKGTVSFNAEALRYLSALPGNENIVVAIEEVDVKKLNAVQQGVLTGKTVVKALTTSVTSGTTPVSVFGSGRETITVGVTPTTGQDVKNFNAYHISERGTLSRLKTNYTDSKNLSFVTNHNSDFVIVYDAKVNNTDIKSVYRAYNRNNGDHLLTADAYEYQTALRAGWQDEGEVFFVNTVDGTPVYRLYNKSTGEHFYTTNAGERQNAIRAGWQDEKSQFNSDGDHPIYRVYNPNQKSNNHLFTMSLDEKSYLVRLGWLDEDQVFWVY